MARPPAKGKSDDSGGNQFAWKDAGGFTFDVRVLLNTVLDAYIKARGNMAPNAVTAYVKTLQGLTRKLLQTAGMKRSIGGLEVCEERLDTIIRRWENGAPVTDTDFYEADKVEKVVVKIVRAANFFSLDSDPTMEDELHRKPW